MDGLKTGPNGAGGTGAAPDAAQDETQRKIVLTGLASPVAALAFDGERLIPGASGPEVELEHVHRYLFAAHLIADRDVLDIASGDGYGSDILAQRARTVTGVDIDAEAVRMASKRYQRENLRFKVGKCEAIPSGANSVDAVVSFETIEHMDDHDAFLREVRRILRLDGLLIVSTPDKTVYNDELAEPNHFHVHELERHEFETLLKSNFKHVRLLGQRVAFGSFLAGDDMSGFEIASHDKTSYEVTTRTLREASVYWVAVASDAPLPELPVGLYQGDAQPNPISSIMGGVRERDEEIIRLRTHVQDYDAVKDAARRTQDAADQLYTRFVAVETELEDLKATHAGLRESLRLARAREKERSAQCEDLQEQLSAAELAAARKEAAQKQLAIRNGDLQASLDAISLEKLAEQARNKTLLETVASLQGELTEAAAARDAAAQAARELAERIETAELEARWSRQRGSPFVRDAVSFLKLTRKFGPMRAARVIAEARAIRDSGEFKELYYLRRYPDVAGARIDPIVHYLAYGVMELRDPSPAFSTRAYIQRYPEIAGARVNPFFHYVRHGRFEGRSGAPPASSALPTRLASTEPARNSFSARPESLPLQLDQSPSDDDLGAAAPPAHEVSLYSVRPDSIIAEEAARGRAFVETHRLLSDAPDFAAAARELGSGPKTLGLVEGAAGPPDVTIIVPVYGQLAYTMNCLHSLFTHVSRFSAEIILVDDASPDETQSWLQDMEGLVYHRMAQNGGFIHACNTGASLARGRFIVLLNNDTRVAPGWLDELIGAFDVLPGAGLVGSKLFYPDGTLQEAGGIIWADASAWNYGRNDDPNKPEYCYARQVDYVSGAAIALPTELWDALDGFDTVFTPAYCEDSDLALRVRHDAGRSVWMQPLSRVIHYEGKTSGTDVTKGVKAYQVRNGDILRDRWAPRLGHHRANGEAPLLEKDRGATLRALVLDANTPEPDRDAGSLTCFGLIEALQSAGYKVTFAAETNLLYMPGPTSALQRIGVEVLYAPFAAGMDQLLKERGQEFDFVLVFRKDVAARRLKALRRHCPRAKIAFHCSDLHYLREQRHAELENDPRALRAAEITRREELKVINGVDVSIVHSTYERDVLAADAPSARVYVFPWILDAEVDVAPFAQRRDIAFLGGYRHPPNVDAVKYFVTDIWPLVRNLDRDLHFIVAGADVPPELESLHGRDNVIVEGFVPDLAPFFSGLRLSVAPIRYGAGIKGKIAVSLAHGVPAVATACAAEGMSLLEGDCVVVRDDPAAFAKAVVDLCADEDRWRAMSARARAFVSETYGSKLARERINAVLTLAGAPVAAETP